MSRLHQNNFASNLTSGTTAGDTTSPLNSIPTIDAPFYLAFDATNINGNYEVVDCTSKTTTNVNHAATTKNHTTAEEVRMIVPAVEFDGFSPVGQVVDFAGSSAPTGWLICNGATISQTTYAALYAVTGHSYGANPGGGNFILPDCREKVTVGYKSGSSEFGALGNVAVGEKTHTLDATEIPSHVHPINAYASSAAGANSYLMRASTGTGSSNPMNSDSIGSGTAHNNIQPSIVFNKIIRY